MFKCLHQVCVFWRNAWLVLFLLFSTPTFCEQINAVTELFYPYQVVNSNGELDGYSIAIAKALFKLTGDTADIELLPWAVAYQKAASTPNTLIFSMGRNQIREDKFYWIGPIAKDVLYFYALADSNIQPSGDLEDFRPYLITVVKDATTHQYLSAANFSNIYAMPATDSNADEQVRIKMLISGRADLLIATHSSIRWSLEQLALPADTLKVVYRASPLDSNLYFGFSRSTDSEVVRRYQTAMDKFKLTDTYRNLRERWQVE